MIELKSLTIGLALGLIIGVYISPTIDAPKMKQIADVPQAITKQVQSDIKIVDPTDAEMIDAIFRAQGWNLGAAGRGSTAIVERCGPSLTTLVCNVDLKLAWVNSPTRMQVELKLDDGKFSVIRMKTTQ
jgi:hypothetical protein